MTTRPGAGLRQRGFRRAVSSGPAPGRSLPLPHAAARPGRARPAKARKSAEASPPPSRLPGRYRRCRSFSGSISAPSAFPRLPARRRFAGKSLPERLGTVFSSAGARFCLPPAPCAASPRLPWAGYGTLPALSPAGGEVLGGRPPAWRGGIPRPGSRKKARHGKTAFSHTGQKGLCPARRAGPCPKATLFLPAGRAVPWAHR